MKSVISEIFDGERGTENIVRSDKYKQMRKQTTVFYENFLNTLNDDQKTMFENVLDNMFSLEAEQSKTSFEEGFKLGLLVAFETFAE